jgi:hypothetical protein
MTSWGDRKAAAMAGFEGATAELRKRSAEHARLQREIAGLDAQRAYLAECGDTAGVAQAQRALLDRQGAASREYDALVAAELGRDEFAATLEAIQGETAEMPRQGLRR